MEQQLHLADYVQAPERVRVRGVRVEASFRAACMAARKIARRLKRFPQAVVILEGTGAQEFTATRECNLGKARGRVVGRIDVTGPDRRHRIEKISLNGVDLSLECGPDVASGDA